MASPRQAAAATGAPPPLRRGAAIQRNDVLDPFAASKGRACRMSLIDRSWLMATVGDPHGQAGRPDGPACPRDPARASGSSNSTPRSSVIWTSGKVSPQAPDLNRTSVLIEAQPPPNIRPLLRGEC